jgi:hypothetical protein
LSLEDGLLAGVIASCFTSVSCVLSAGTLSFLGVSVVVGPVIVGVTGVGSPTSCAPSAYIKGSLNAYSPTLVFIT